jgi:hypothetical protein
MNTPRTDAYTDHDPACDLNTIWGGECTCGFKDRPISIPELRARLAAFEALAEDRETELVDRVIAAECDLAAREEELAVALNCSLVHEKRAERAEAELARVKVERDAAIKESAELAGELAELNDRLIPKISSDRDSWRAKAEENARDAERYRWIRTGHNGMCGCPFAETDSAWDSGDNLDAAIDQEKTP